jgi:hypothetical protein
MIDPDMVFDMENIPQVEVRVAKDSYRWNVIDGLAGHANRGIELGVAAGSYSRRMVHSGRFARFWGVDSYSDNHTTAQYKEALTHVGIEAPYTLLRMTFAEALDLFPDNFFDFIYVDGYAHTGEEGGRTMIDWYAKLRVGGIMAGDDYSPKKWPLVVWGVNHFVQQLDVALNVTDQVMDATYNRFPSWFFEKPDRAPALPLRADPELITIGGAARLAREAEDRAKRRARREARAKTKDQP